MPRVFTINRVVLIALMAILPALVSAATGKLVLSSAEVNLIEIPAETSASVPIYAAIYSGSSSDPAGLEGLAWVTARLVARQAAREFSVTVTREMTLFTGTAKSNAREQDAHALSRAMLKPSFSAEDLQQVRLEALAEVESIRHDPARLAIEAFHAYVYRGDPRGHPSPGSASGIGKITLEETLGFIATHYRKGNFAIGVAVPPGASVQAEIATRFAAMPDGNAVVERRAPSFLPRPGFHVVECSEAPLEGILLVGHPSPVTPAHPDYFNLQAALLGVTGESGVPLPSSPGSSTIILSPRSSIDGGVRGLALLLDRIREATAIEMTPVRLEVVRNSMRGPAPDADGASGTGVVARLEEFLHRSPGLAARRNAEVDRITTESVREAAGRHLYPDRMAIIAVVRSSESFVGEILGSAAMKDTGPWSRDPRLSRNDFEIVKVDDLFD